ncbi:hypothetical protein [Wukongibacter sp. M2B1]|uniref:hypothetical protein n=1 Tax=Wukongibacter sp. M2B1 TaxID=3088895 RepID=UPI003D7924E1
MNNKIKQYEMQEAKKRMGTYSGNATNATTGMNSDMTNTVSTGMTNTMGTNANMTSQAKKLKNSEKVKAQEDMNQMY